MAPDDEGRAAPGPVVRAHEGAGPTDFDAVYEGTPPWEIGRPQPALAELADAGMFTGRVLDVGCGTGEHALLAAELGLEATGVDSSARAIDIARAKAADRGLSVRFMVMDALDLGSLGGQFDTVADSGLFHVFDDDRRARYVDSLRAVTAPGGRVLVLCFSDRQPGEWGPRRVTEEEIRACFRDGWRVDAVDDARMVIVISPDGARAWRAVVTRSP